MPHFSAKHYSIKSQKDADRAKSYADSINPETLLHTDTITNCITEIPQDIKLELVDGTLTLKAGSKVYVPNGSGVFDEITIASDLSTTRSANIQEMYFVSNNGTVFNQWNNIYSGASAPSGQTYMIWYDTANNIVKATGDGGSTWTGGFSLPICLATSNNAQITSIDQVFNGFGYIGSTVFALPGVKGLVPNGRNEDGTLKNEEIVTTNVMTANAPTHPYWMILNDGNDLRLHAVTSTTPYTNSSFWYDEQANIFYTQGGSGILYTKALYFATISGTNAGITSFTPKLPFRAVDQNDFNRLDEEVTTLDAQNVKVTGNQTINDIKTFSSAPKLNYATANTVAIIGANKELTHTTGVTSTELGYLAGVTGNIQNQFNGKQATISGGASTITTSNLTASRALISDSSGKVAVSAVTSTELGYLDGVTSAIQTQLNGKQASGSYVTTNTSQTVSAVKTHTAEIVSQKTGGCYYLKNANYDYLTNPSANQNQYIVWRDKNNKDLSYVSQSITTDGTAQMGIFASTYKTDGTRVAGGLAAYATRSGSVYTYAPTPAVADNSTKIATTAWMNNKHKVVSALPSSPDANTFYYIPE